MSAAQSPARHVDEADARSNLIHREIVQLTLLILVSVALFFLTRAIAANNRDMSLRDAAEWYRRGQLQLADGDAASAVDSLRRATVRNRTNKDYVLALARALAASDHDDAAWTALIALRESNPEDADINLELARIAARRPDVNESVRYYRNALYAPWRAGTDALRREARIEFVRFLLAHDQRSRAIAELVALAGDLPDDTTAHIEVGQLFSKAGDSRRALDQFQRALRLAPDNGSALVGAGLAAFAEGDYASARRYLRSLPDGAGDVRETREIAELVLSKDPLAPRIDRVERRRRLDGALAYIDQRLASCAAAGQAGATESDRNELKAFRMRLKRPGQDEDTIEAGSALADRLQRGLARSCPAAAPMDRAMTIIADRHGVEQR